jgi:hypothetical protein
MGEYKLYINRQDSEWIKLAIITLLRKCGPFGAEATFFLSMQIKPQIHKTEYYSWHNGIHNANCE